MNKFITSLVLVLGLGTSFAQNIWNALTAFPLASPLASVFFLNKDTGWVTGFHTHVLKTMDGGQTWARPQFGLLNNTITVSNIQFVNDSLGYLSINYSMYKTVDGGTWWNAPMSSPRLLTTDSIIRMQFINNSTKTSYRGMLLTRSRRILINQDDNSWRDVNTSYNYNINSVYFKTYDTAYAVGNNGLIMRSLDGGTTFNLLVVGHPKCTYRDVQAVPGGTSVVGDSNSSSGTTSCIVHFIGLGGPVLKPTSFLASINKVQIVRTNPLHVWAFTSIGMIKSEDGGINWLQMPSPTANMITNAFFVNENLGFGINNGDTPFKYAPRPVNIISKHTLPTNLKLDNFNILGRNSIGRKYNLSISR